MNFLKTFSLVVIYCFDKKYFLGNQKETPFLTLFNIVEKHLCIPSAIAISEVNVYRLPHNGYILLKFNMACSPVKIEYVVFMIRLQKLSKELRYIVHYGGKQGL